MSSSDWASNTLHSKASNYRSPGPTRSQACILPTLTLLAIALVLYGGSPGIVRPAPQGQGDTDSDLFRKVILRVHTGESAHDAFQHVFEEYQYPVRSILNYRTPLHAWLLGHLPGLSWGQALLMVLSLFVSLLVYSLIINRAGVLAAVVAVLLMQGAFAYVFVDDLYLYTEPWAGTLITLSVCAYQRGWRRLGTASGLLAIFFRELAVPYAVVSTWIAWRCGRRREMAFWVAGLLVYGGYLGLHVLAVLPRLPRSSGIVNAGFWVQRGGLPFVLATVRINLWLLALPYSVTAIYLPLALLGLSGWPGETAVRIAGFAGICLGCFLFVGGIYNTYWGLLYAPLLPLGLVLAPVQLRVLVRHGGPAGGIMKRQAAEHS